MINDSPYLVGASLFYSFRGSSTNYYFPIDFTVGGAVASFGRRLEWPDDFFRVMWSAKYMQKEYEGSQEDIDNYIGGLQEYTPLLMPIYAPNINSFRRFRSVIVVNI